VKKEQVCLGLSSRIKLVLGEDITITEATEMVEKTLVRKAMGDILSQNPPVLGGSFVGFLLQLLFAG
jgi:hypothetical protein